jgi:hypothetical protein
MSDDLLKTKLYDSTVAFYKAPKNKITKYEFGPKEKENLFDEIVELVLVEQETIGEDFLYHWKILQDANDEKSIELALALWDELDKRLSFFEKLVKKCHITNDVKDISKNEEFKMDLQGRTPKQFFEEHGPIIFKNDKDGNVESHFTNLDPKEEYLTIKSARKAAVIQYCINQIIDIKTNEKIESINKRKVCREAFHRFCEGFPVIVFKNVDHLYETVKGQLKKYRQ